MDRQDTQVVYKLKKIALISLAFMFVEIIGGVLANSISIFADAFHLLSDVLAYMISLFAVLMSYKASPKTLTFGYQKLQPLGALINVLIIWIVTFQLFMQASTRIYNRSLVQQPKFMLITSVFGLCCNLYIMKILHNDEHGGHNCSSKNCTLNTPNLKKNQNECCQDLSCSNLTKKNSLEQLKSSNGKASHEFLDSCNDANCLNNKKQKNSKTKSPKKKSINDYNRYKSPKKSKESAYQLYKEDQDLKYSEVSSESLDVKLDALLNEETMDYKDSVNGLLDDLIAQECYEGVQNEENMIVNYDDKDQADEKCCDHQKLSQKKRSERKDSSSELESSDSQMQTTEDFDVIQRNINLKAAYVHIITDIILSIGVIISAGIINVFAPKGHSWTYWQLADPLCTYLFSFMAIYTTIPITKQAVSLLLNGCDNPRLVFQIQKQLSEDQCIEKVQNLKVWSGKKGMHYGALRALVRKGNYTSLRNIFRGRKMQGFVELIEVQQHTQ